MAIHRVSVEYNYMTHLGNYFPKPDNDKNLSSNRKPLNPC